jgi:hypothetical protein
MAVVIGAGGGAVFMQNDVAVTANTTIDTSKNWMSIGPITINSGITVTINSGATWVVV